MLLDKSVRRQDDGSWEVFTTPRTSLVHNHPIFRVTNFEGVRPIELDDEAIFSEIVNCTKSGMSSAEIVNYLRNSRFDEKIFTKAASRHVRYVARTVKSSCALGQDRLTTFA